MSLEVEELKKQASVYRARFRTLVEAQLELLSADGWETLEPQNQPKLEEIELQRG
ncbi:Septum site-determining protein DivIVA [compost metagenome]